MSALFSFQFSESNYVDCLLNNNHNCDASAVKTLNCQLDDKFYKDFSPKKKDDKKSCGKFEEGTAPRSTRNLLCADAEYVIRFEHNLERL